MKTVRARHTAATGGGVDRWRRPLLLAVLCRVCLACAGAQHLSEPQFIQVLTNNSIMDGVVTTVAQDAQGYVWAGGTTGIARYDAYHFVKFPLKADDGGAEVAGAVTAIAAGRDGRLWLGLASVGLVALDPRTGRSMFYRHDPKNPKSLTDSGVQTVISDGADGFWIGTQRGGLDHFYPATGTFVHFRAARGGLPDDNVTALLLDGRGDLWIGGEKGLARKARAGGAPARALRDPGDEARLARQGVAKLRQDRAGRLWVGTLTGGLLIVDPASGQARWLADGEAELGWVSAIEEVNGNQMWIARSNGIDVRATDTGALQQRIRHVAGRIGALASSSVQAILRDRSGVLFVGMYGGGVQRYVPPLSGIAVVRPALDDPWDGNTVRSIAEMRNGEIWLGRGEGGVSVLDQALRRDGDIGLRDRRVRGGASAMVGALAQGPDGHAWIGTDKGLHELDEGRRFLRRYELAGRKVRRMLVDRDGILWVGTGDGLLRRAPGAAALTPVMLAQGGRLRGNVDALEQDPAGRLWAGNAAGVFRIDAATGVAHKLQAAPAPADGRHAVKGMLADADGLWIDSDGGRYRVDRIDGDQARYTLAIDSKGKGGHPIGANLLRDQSGKIWTHRGVHDLAARRYDELSVADGVDIGTGWFRAFARLRDGRMLFGGSAGLLQVRPDRYAPWSYRPPVVLTALSVGGQAVAVPAAGGIALAPPQRSFRAEFSALDYSLPEHNRYRYRLHGYDAGWRETNANWRVASYDNLPPGQYSLQVQGSNRNGVWSDAQAALAVRVLPAWWETWWARLGMLALAGAGVLGLVQWRTLHLRGREAELASRVAERTAELQEVSAALAAKSQALELASLTDPLTGLHNRRFLSEHIDADIALSVRRHEERLRGGGEAADDADLIFFLIDIDHFKQVNDQYGHAAGDAVLSQMRGRLLAIFRESDYVIRWGGEEFLVVARGTGRERAAELAERARAAVADAPFVLADGRALPKTCSIGYACFPPARPLPRALDWQAVVEIADAALYVVKGGGRDGWCGVTAVELDDLAVLQQLVRQPLTAWDGAGGVMMQRS